MSIQQQSTFTVTNAVRLPWEHKKPKKTLYQRAPKSLPLMTLFHCGLQLGAYYFVYYRQRGVRPSAVIMLDIGAKDRASIASGDWYRYLSPYFVPCHLAGLIMNLFFQGYCGFFLEPEWGSVAVFFIIWASVYCGIRGSCHSGGSDPSSGSSAAVLGLTSAYFVDLIRNWQAHDKFEWRRFALFWILMVAVSYGMCGLDFNDPKLAGFGQLFGLFVSIILCPMEIESTSTTMIRGFALVLAGIILFAMDEC